MQMCTPVAQLRASWRQAKRAWRDLQADLAQATLT
jgi:hypothetical protein